MKVRRQLVNLAGLGTNERHSCPIFTWTAYLQEDSMADWTPISWPSVRNFFESNPWVVISGAAFLALIAYSIRPFDSTVLGLIIILILPFLGLFVESMEIFGSKFKFRVSSNGREVSIAGFLMAHFLTNQELKRLWRLREHVPIPVDRKNFAFNDFKSQINRLRDLGFIVHFHDKGLHRIENADGIQFANDPFYITDIGRQYLAFRDQLLGPIKPEDLPPD
jgi:hypothetical protein